VAFDLSVAVREEISRFQDSIRAARENAGRLDVDLVQQQRAMGEAEEAEKKARQDMEHAVTPLLDSEQVKQRRADVRKSRGTLSDETRARQRVADLRARYQHAVDEAASAERKATQDMERSAIPPLSTEEARQRRAVVRRARGTLGDAARARQRVTDIQSQLNVLSSAAAPAAVTRRRGSGRIVAALAAVAGIAVLAGGALLGGPALPIGVAAGVALIGVAVFLFV
jgi:DNA repair exonuclease SbcCD ATPase subunit